MTFVCIFILNFYNIYNAFIIFFMLYFFTKTFIFTIIASTSFVKASNLLDFDLSKIAENDLQTPPHRPIGQNISPSSTISQPATEADKIPPHLSANSSIFLPSNKMFSCAELKKIWELSSITDQDRINLRIRFPQQTQNLNLLTNEEILKNLKEIHDKQEKEKMFLNYNQQIKRILRSQKNNSAFLKIFFDMNHLIENHLSLSIQNHDNSYTLWDLIIHSPLPEKNNEYFE